MTQFNILKKYSFEVYPKEILGQDFSAVDLMATMSYVDAQREADVQALHTQVYAYLPAGTPSDYTRLTYLKFKMVSGEDRIIAREWIRTETVEERNDFTAVITIPNTSPQDGEILRQLLAQNGFTGYSIKFE